jgi:hypothetical protein
MTDHPITPPPELVEQWREEAAHRQYTSVEADEHIAEQAAQWGADMELEACCEWFADDVVSEVVSVVAELRAARRPKAPSLKEQAMQAWCRFQDTAHKTAEEMMGDMTTIRRALEALPE